MYKVKLNNCGGEMGKVQVEVVFKVYETQLIFIINEAHEAFRQIEVVDDETGELIYSSYASSNWFSPMSTEGEVLDEIYKILEVM